MKLLSLPRKVDSETMLMEDVALRPQNEVKASWEMDDVVGWRASDAGILDVILRYAGRGANKLPKK